MLNERTFHGRLSWAAFWAAVLLLGGCAAKTPVPRVTPVPAGHILEYKMPAGRVLQYQDKLELETIHEIQGRVLVKTLSATGDYSFEPKGRKGQDYLLHVTINDMAESCFRDEYDSSPDMKTIKGKNFDMILSPLGSEVDVSGAKSITYEFLSMERDVSDKFARFFPDLPDKPVKVGDSWPSAYTNENKSDTTDIRTEYRVVNTFEALETVEGMECARIISKSTGITSGTGTAESGNMLFEGKEEGTATWYFALKEGIFARLASELKAEDSQTIQGAQTTVIHTTRRQKAQINLVNR